MTQRPFIVPVADRVANLPPYIFATVFAMKEKALQEGREVIDLGVGNPDGRARDNVIAALSEAMNDQSWNCHRYSTFRGLPRFREAIAAWYFNRFGVTLEADRQTLPLIGSKEGLANLMRAYLNAGDTVIIPTPCYPAYFGAARLCEAKIAEIPLRPDNGFRPVLADIPNALASEARMLILNYPNNPTGGVCDLDFYREAVAWCRQHKVILVSDIAYSELGFDPEQQPVSVFQVDGALDVAIEFQSLSKSHNLAGWRVGFAVGGTEVIDTLAKVKSNVDFSLFGGVQMAAVEALSGNQQVCADNRLLYEKRARLLVDGYQALGWQVTKPTATMYIWAAIPPAYGEDDFRFVSELFEQTGVLLSPGSGFGEYGQGYCRTSLVVDQEAIARVLALFRASSIKWC